jgi:hypothetical protein
MSKQGLIDGLMAENLARRNALGYADDIARTAQYDRDRAEHNAEMSKIKLQKAESKIKSLEQENEFYKNLLSRPMQEIASQNGDFKKTYDEQQQLLAEWILGQKAFRETSKILSSKLGQSEGEFAELQKFSINAVLQNNTQFGNDASTNPVLNHHAEQILAIRKRNGKA